MKLSLHPETVWSVHQLSLAAVALALVILALFWFMGRAKAKPNVISGSIVSLEGLEGKRKIYAQVSCLAETIATTPIVESDNTLWNTSFLWSFRGRKEGIVLKDDLTFEVFEASHDTPKSSDKKLFSVDLAINTLLDSGVGSETTRELFGPQGQKLHVTAGVYCNNKYFSIFDRLSVSWQNESRKISFWTRLLTLPIGLYLLYSSFVDARAAVAFQPRTLALVDALVGVYFLWQSSQSAFPQSLSFNWSLCLAVVGYMLAAGRWLEKSTDASHWVRVGSVAGLSVGFILADLRGEPGSGWLSYPGRLIFTPYNK